MRRHVLSFLAVFALGWAGCAQQPSTIRVLTYNIRHGEGMDKQVDLERIAEVIKAAKPDLVSLQEVDRGVPRTASVDEAEVLGGLCRMHPVFEKNADMQGGDYGNAILSRYPIESHRNYHLPRIGNNEQRGLLEVHVRVGGKPLTFYATHLDHQKNDRERMESIEKLRDLLTQQQGEPAIVAGDFNAEPETPVIAKVKSFLRVCTDEDLATNSFPADKPDRRIDYVLYTDDGRLECVESHVIEEPVASDHRPVLSVLKLRPEGTAGSRP
jgi:endonuclease/exonuclease/phosphatase family metal-dependent hydrolase